ncbi:MAG TPA: DUF6002 family protein [Pseudonocardiaceae bacterium]|nr:DUF6002 family protein [Pseudonocardiaceae bacterium]
MSINVDREIVIENSLSRYGEYVRVALAALSKEEQPAPTREFHPGYELPDPTEELVELFAPSKLAFADLGSYRSKHLTLLDLTRNPHTRTTKTCASLVIVARAVHYIQTTGERVMILSPSSGNKATALRDSVLRAFQAGLVTPEQLQIVVVIPRSSRDKVWSSPLIEDPALRARNAVVTYQGERAADVKALARQLVDGYTEQLRNEHGMNLWYTLDINNYKVADIVRACAEYEYLPRDDGRHRLHVHAVSSAYGLLGHNFGVEILASGGRTAPSAHYFLVQHLATPDMVLSLHYDSTSRENMPNYRYVEDTGLYQQQESPYFPGKTSDPEENLDPTFYTREPPTSAVMNSIIRTQGGGGIVVSLHECLDRYPAVRAMLSAANIRLPKDPHRIREWSLVMAMTGILNAIDRGLIHGDDILVHGSGAYEVADYDPISDAWLEPVSGIDELAKVVWRAASGRLIA